MTATIRPPACTAQYTDTNNSWACSGRHIDGWHTVLSDDGGHVQHLWLDPQQPDRYDDALDELLVRLADLVPWIRGRATDPRVTAVVAAHDRLVAARTGVAV